MASLFTENPTTPIEIYVDFTGLLGVGICSIILLAITLALLYAGAMSFLQFLADLAYSKEAKRYYAKSVPADPAHPTGKPTHGG